MFIEIKMHGDDATELRVYGQTDSSHIASKEEIQLCDNTDHPFVADKQVLGTWKTFDFIRNRDDFNPTRKTWRGAICFSSALNSYQTVG